MSGFFNVRFRFGFSGNLLQHNMSETSLVHAQKTLQACYRRQH
jgi:hypothetical protein